MEEQKTLGDYQIIKQLGQGSLGAVFLAEHRFTMQQHAVKVLPDELASDRAFVQRFQEEVAVIAGLEHPHIAKMHNVSFAQGLYLLISECIVDTLGETTNLYQYLLSKGKMLSEEKVWTILHQIASALDYAHCGKNGARKLTHRGLKFNNILIGTDPHTGQGVYVYLSDFGLSKIIGASAVLTRTFKAMAEAVGVGGQLALNRTGQDRYPNPPIETQKLSALHQSFVQNFSFLAPEQKRAESNTAYEDRIDTYSFGVLAYYLLVGDYPEGYFPLPSHARKDLKYNWDGLVTECLQIKPQDRPERLVELLESVHNSTSSEFAYAFAKRHGIDLSCLEREEESGKKVLEKQLSMPLTQPNQIIDHALAFVEAPAAALLEQESNEAELWQRVKGSKGGSVEGSIKQYHPEQKQILSVQPLLSETVIIKEGHYYRGSNKGNRDETPRHEVFINAFAIDIHPVTNEQFVRFLEAIGGEKDPQNLDVIRLKDSRIKRSTGRLTIESGYAKHPVVGVTWYGAIAYAKWVGRRLPTEVEWEVACYGGLDASLYPTGEDIEKSQANFFSSDTTSVMSYAPNGYGLYDMVGNVYEWCYDWYGYNYYEISVQEPDNPKGPLQGVYRVLRGGCWKSLKEDLRCSKRHRNNPGTVNGTYGFRCAIDVI